mmetsp:Transcript_1609/g.4697  ORF Transcript_1609/g.4697 Transcript_1609/m.4697 type:complete len:269 (+) Transcript_1609:276-1082(+)
MRRPRCTRRAPSRSRGSRLTWTTCPRRSPGPHWASPSAPPCAWRGTYTWHRPLSRLSCCVAWRRRPRCGSPRTWRPRRQTARRTRTVTWTANTRASWRASTASSSRCASKPTAAWSLRPRAWRTFPPSSHRRWPPLSCTGAHCSNTSPTTLAWTTLGLRSCSTWASRGRSRNRRRPGSRRGTRWRLRSSGTLSCGCADTLRAARAWAAPTSSATTTRTWASSPWTPTPAARACRCCAARTTSGSTSSLRRSRSAARSWPSSWGTRWTR